MYESCGGNFPGGSSQGNGFHLIQDYFKQKTCKHCSCNYSSDGIELIREEPGMVVVRVSCSNCGQPLGIALVGMSNNSKEQVMQSPRQKSTYPTLAEDKPYPSDWTKHDVSRLANNPRITLDDVLDAHEFFSSLGSDWSKFLPRKNKKTNKPISA